MLCTHVVDILNIHLIIYYFDIQNLDFFLLFSSFSKGGKLDIKPIIIISWIIEAWLLKLNVALT